jgi:predicted anti-sigma-YlaC factor YlaD
MKHPNQATLALEAGGELGLFARWKTERHLSRCDRCRDEVAQYERLREVLPELDEMPGVPWTKLAAEMKANIRLGIAAGECVRAGAQPLRETPLFAGARIAVALASLATLLVAVVVLQHPSPMVRRSQGAELGTTANGIEVENGANGLRLLHKAMNDGDVTYMPGAQGSMRARYVDPETGYVTVTNVYAD